LPPNAEVLAASTIAPEFTTIPAGALFRVPDSVRVPEFAVMFPVDVMVPPKSRRPGPSFTIADSAGLCVIAAETFRSGSAVPSAVVKM
jgi:hypothetical protein